MTIGYIITLFQVTFPSRLITQHHYLTTQHHYLTTQHHYLTISTHSIYIFDVSIYIYRVRATAVIMVTCNHDLHTALYCYYWGI